MPAFGKFSPFPIRFGGGKTNVQAIFEGLAADRGTSVDAADTTKSVGIDTLAMAKAVAGVWATNERLGNMWDPWRCDMATLARWETILALQPASTDTNYDRRLRVAKVFKRFGRAVTKAYIEELMLRDVPEVFVAVESISVSAARIVVANNSYGFGVVDDVPWASSVSHILVRLQKPAGWTEGQFYDAADKVSQLLDPVVSAWSTFDWYRPGPVNSNVVGGPSAGGFYLDDDHNLDNEVFDA